MKINKYSIKYKTNGYNLSYVNAKLPVRCFEYLYNELKNEVHNSPRQIVKWQIKQKKMTLVKEIQQWYLGFADNILNY